MYSIVITRNRSVGKQKHFRTKPGWPLPFHLPWSSGTEKNGRFRFLCKPGASLTKSYHVVKVRMLALNKSLVGH